MIYAQFYQMSVPGDWNNFVSKPIEACGDRAVLILDGRNSMPTHQMNAQLIGRQRGYVGYTLNKGDSFTRSKEIQAYRSLTD